MGNMDSGMMEGRDARIEYGEYKTRKEYTLVIPNEVRNPD